MRREFAPAVADGGKALPPAPAGLTGPRPPDPPLADPQATAARAVSRPRLAPALMLGACAVAACAITTALSLSATATGDYVVDGPVGGDNAGPAINALVHGSFAGYAAHQPAIGLTSILLRVPLAALAPSLGGGGLLTYRLGAAACLMSLGLFVAWLIARRRPESVGWLPGLMAAVLLVSAPALRDGIQAGHPEGVVAGVLATGAVIAATRGRDRWAAVMLGLALGAKPWAVIAVPPVLVAVPGRRFRTVAIAGGLAAITIAPAPLADPAAFARAIHGEGATHLIDAFSIWWPISSPVHVAVGHITAARLLPLGMSRSMASLLGLVPALALLALGWQHARRRGGACDALALLALLGVVRCIIDTTHLEYYYLAALIPLAAWEAVGLGRAPLLTGVTSIAIGLVPVGALQAHPALVSAASIVWTLALAGYLARRAFHPPASIDVPKGEGARFRPETVHVAASTVHPRADGLNGSFSSFA